jgi:asparagine synthase (glutamine-hydrolysing)
LGFCCCGDGDDFIAGRDPMGVKRCIMVWTKEEESISPEMKPIADQCKTFSTFPPGHYYTAKNRFCKILQTGI